MSEKIEIVIVDESTGETQPSPPAPSGGTTTTPAPAAPAAPATPETNASTPTTPANSSPNSVPPGSQTQTTSGSVTWLDRFGKVLDQAFKRGFGRPLRRMEMAFRRTMQIPQQILGRAGQIAGGLGGRVLDRFLPRGNESQGDSGTGKSHRLYKITATSQRNRMIRLLYKIANQARGGRDGILEGSFTRKNQRLLPNPQRRIAGPSTGTTVATTGAATTGARAGGVAGAARVAGGAAARLLTHPIGIAVAIILAAMAAVAVGLYGLAKVFKHNEQELKSVSPQISAALAEKEFGRTRMRVERNEKMGDATAAMTRTWTRFEEAQYELWTAIYELLMPFAPILEMFVDFLTAIVQSLKAMLKLLMLVVQILDAIYQVMTFGAFGELVQGGVVDALNDYQNAMQDATRAWIEVLTRNSGKGQSNTNNFGRNPFKNQSKKPTAPLFNPQLPRGKGRII